MYNIYIVQKISRKRLLRWKLLREAKILRGYNRGKKCNKKLRLLKRKKQIMNAQKLVIRKKKPFKKKLSIDTCLRFLLPIAKDWHTIGTLLKVPSPDLEQIESDYLSCRDRVREMIKKWLKQIKPRPTWKRLAEAVKYIEPSLARNIILTSCRTIGV